MHPPSTGSYSLSIFSLLIFVHLTPDPATHEIHIYEPLILVGGHVPVQLLVLLGLARAW
jgi:hypothetical protein